SSRSFTQRLTFSPLARYFILFRQKKVPKGQTSRLDTESQVAAVQSFAVLQRKAFCVMVLLLRTIGGLT
ncbi:hypothetical protein ORI99_09895, partial [Alishewanella sp. SMS9]|nr:hypothetical protein [Alishewanella sp. SMS9]